MALSPTPMQSYSPSSLLNRSQVPFPVSGHALLKLSPLSPQIPLPRLSVCHEASGSISSISLICAASSASSSTGSSIMEGHGRNLSAEKVSAVLFDMDGVLCNSEERSRLAAVDLFAEMGVKVTEEDFFPFMGTGEANFLGGVARVYGVKDFDVASAKSRFFQIYLEKYAKPNSGLGFPGALDLIMQCKAAGLKVALASSADRLKIDANLAAAGLPFSVFDAIVSADAFKNLKPAPDIFLAAAKALDVATRECVVVEDALAGLQAANAAGMRCIVVTTTLSGDKLAPEGPSLIRKDIADIKLDDILKLHVSDEP
ncbi:hypothetical protein KP509_06G023000 [Ceratopteris richardii]|uniref:Uncharacterized protein n=1 Tax=Ceratopteris richardii TaxID=49495 RepID=A0A8T2UM29_CERRI|nr:hypothetical protein KP509_06G023000 [Ceratopteris richardii]